MFINKNYLSNIFYLELEFSYQTIKNPILQMMQLLKRIEVSR